MTRICPKCDYARRPTDDCPDWQCPSCQVAYNKIGATQESASYGRYAAPVAQPASASSGIAKWVALAVVAGAAAWFGKPAWETLKARSDTVAQTVPQQQPDITLYSAEWCGYCTATREFFNANNIRYVELDIEKTTEGYEGHKKLGGNGVPLIVIGDDLMRGYNESVLKSSLRPWLQGS